MEENHKIRDKFISSEKIYLNYVRYNTYYSLPRVIIYLFYIKIICIDIICV